MMEFTFFESHRDKRTHNRRRLTWPEVKALLTTHVERMDKEGPGFSPARYVNAPCACGKPTCPTAYGHALKTNVEEVYLLPIDLDKGRDGQDLTSPEDQQHLEAIRAKGLAFMAHTSHSYAPPHKAKWHVFIPLTRPIRGDEYRTVWKAAMRFIGVPSGIKTDNAARFWNLPSCPPGAVRDSRIQDGQALDVDWLLSQVEPEPPKPPPELSAGDRPPASPGLLKRAWEAVYALGPAVEGQGGHDHTFRVTRILIDDYALSEEEAWPLLEAWNNGCVPPWSQDELLHKLEDAVGHGKSPEYAEARDGIEFLAVIEKLHAPEVGSVRALLMEAKTLWDSALADGEATGEDRLYFKSARDLVTAQVEPTPWLVRGLVTLGGIAVVSAEPKATKTWATMELCLAIATGDKAFGEFPADKGSAAYFFAEDQQSAVASRIRALCRGSGREVPAGFYAEPCGPGLDVCDDASVIRLLASARQIPDLKLLVLDPLRDVHTGAEDSSDEMSQVMKRLRILSNILGCTVLFVHHNSKGGADNSARRHGQRMRGSGAVHGAINAGFYMTETAIEENTISNTCHVEVKGAKSAGSFVLGLEIEDDPVHDVATSAAWTVSEPGAGACDDEMVTEIVETVGRFAVSGDPPPTEREIHGVLKGPRGVLTKALLGAESKGYVERHFVGDIARGWRLTDMGSKLFETITLRR